MSQENNPSLSDEQLRNLYIVRGLLNERRYSEAYTALCPLLLDRVSPAFEIAGHLHETGLGMPQDILKARMLYFVAAMGGSESAQDKVDLISDHFIKERLVQKDYQGAVGCALSIQNQELQLKGLQLIGSDILSNMPDADLRGLNDEFKNVNLDSSMQDMRSAYNIVIYNITEHHHKVLDINARDCFDRTL